MQEEVDYTNPMVMNHFLADILTPNQLIAFQQVIENPLEIIKLHDIVSSFHF